MKAKPARRRTVAPKPAPKSPAAARPAAQPKQTVAAPPMAASARPAGPARPATTRRRPAPAAGPVLDRERRRLPDAERGVASEADARLLAAARSGHDDLRHQIESHHETGPVMTAGDVDANWADAYAIGDEAPGGDNPTPDQDRVDDIGRALGVTYQDNEELRGSDKIADRDRHRFELDPASSDDWPHDR